MRKVRLGRTGVEVSAISLGAWPIGGPNTTAAGAHVGWTGRTDDEARAALRAAREAGIDHWDSADVYGDGRSERLIGEVLQEVGRDGLFLASKVGWDAGPHDHVYHPEQVRARIDRSLRNLGVDQIDLYYLHHCDFGPEGEYLDDALAELHKARDAGKIRFVGLSDWDPAKVARYAPRVNPDVVQPYRNVAADTYASSGLQGWVEEHDAGVAFFSPIRHGLLLGKYAEPTTWGPGDFRQNVAAFGDAEALATLRAKADALRERFGDHPEPVLGPLLGALLEDSRGSCCLLGLRTPEQVQAASRADAALSGDDAAWVRGLYAEVKV
jgi:aryl-alcohol dehydrogenase-like predicted oxidoreductase